MSVKVIKQGVKDCTHSMVYTGEKKVVTTKKIRCTKCGQEEEHTEGGN